MQKLFSAICLSLPRAYRNTFLFSLSCLSLTNLLAPISPIQKSQIPCIFLFFARFSSQLQSLDFLLGQKTTTISLPILLLVSNLMALYYTVACPLIHFLLGGNNIWLLSSSFKQRKVAVLWGHSKVLTGNCFFKKLRQDPESITILSIKNYIRTERLCLPKYVLQFF